MITYEYKGIDLSTLGGLDSVVSAFNEQGAIGWELVSVLGGIGYFKRASNNGFGGASDTTDIESADDSMTIISTAHPSGEEFTVAEPPTNRRVGRPPRADRQTGVVMAEDTIMPSPESLS